MIYQGTSTYYNSDFEHFGIKGMKWGVRRYQNSDGSLTPAGEKRYSGEVGKSYKRYQDSKKEYKDAVKRYNRKTHNGLVVNDEATKDLMKATRNKQYAKEDLQDSKIDEKLKNHKFSNHEQKFIDKYKSEGMPEHDAEVAAYKRARTEKIMAVAAVTAVAAAASYVAYKHYDNSVDHIIKEGTILQNISRQSDKTNDHDFYSSRGVLDGIKYQGMYGDQLRSNHILGIKLPGNNEVYRTRFKVDKNIKVASQKSAVKALGELVKSDPDFKAKLQASLEATNGRHPGDKQNIINRLGLESLKKGIVDSNVYDALNVNFVDHSPEQQEITDKFFNTLRSRGYGAVKDSNDTKLSGYNTKSATIIFGKGDNMHVDDKHKLSNNEIDRSLGQVAAGVLAKSTAQQAGIGLGAYGVAKAASASANRKRVAKYRKMHPNSGLSNREIERLLDSKGNKW